ncbi:MAG TPA: hypothetical protein VE359_14350 [Vicinamibacteria bacterium]|nr:hypothetical protein [Vicinamibacteria bacterium]
MHRLVGGAVFVVALAPAAARAQDPAAEADGSDDVKLRVSTELRLNARWSQDDRFPLAFPFPPEFVPVGQPDVALQTVSPGTSLEINKASVLLDLDLPRGIAAHVRVDFVDLYDRNPTSTDKWVDVDEAWIGFGRRRSSLEPLPGSSVYALVGKAPKFERQPFRRLDSYGLVSTAFNRFPDLQVQVGGSIGTHVYFFGQVSNGNPLFMRDPNALAGDNGTAEPPNPDPKLHSGFPIVYHAEVEDLELDDRFEYGGGGGLRLVSADQRRGVDLLGFYYRTRLSKEARLNGTFYEGDLDILDGAGGISLPIDGDRREEYGANLDLRWGGFSAFGQVVKEESAGLPRLGFEVEAAYRFALGDLADPGDLFPAVQPAIRFSRLENDFRAPRGFVSPSFAWDWDKWDFGLRLTIVKRLDLTLEYSLHDIAASRKIRHDEALATLRLKL